MLRKGRTVKKDRPRTLLVTVSLGILLASCARTTGQVLTECDPFGSCWPRDYVNSFVDYSNPNFTTIPNVRVLIVDNPNDVCSRFITLDKGLRAYACHLKAGSFDLLILPPKDYVSPSGLWTFDILLKHELGHVLGVTEDNLR